MSGPDASAEAVPPKKKEGWRGVLLTALACGAFLWFWFSPERKSADEMSPMEWVALALKTLPKENRKDAMVSYEIALLADALRLKDPALADEVLKSLPDPLFAAASDASAPPVNVVPPGFPAEVKGTVDAALAAYDLVDIPAGGEKLAAALSQIRVLADPSLKASAAVHLAVVETRLGLADKARGIFSAVPEARQAPLAVPVETAVLFPQADLVAPALSWLTGHSGQAPLIVPQLVQARRQRLANKERGELAIHGSAAEPWADPADPERQRRQDIWAAVEARQFPKVRELTDAAPAGEARALAYFTAARAMYWP